MLTSNSISGNISVIADGHVDRAMVVMLDVFEAAANPETNSQIKSLLNRCRRFWIDPARQLLETMQLRKIADTIVDRLENRMGKECLARLLRFLATGGTDYSHELNCFCDDLLRFFGRIPTDGGFAVIDSEEIEDRIRRSLLASWNHEWMENPPQVKERLSEVARVLEREWILELEDRGAILGLSFLGNARESQTLDNENTATAERMFRKPLWLLIKSSAYWLNPAQQCKVYAKVIDWLTNKICCIQKDSLNVEGSGFNLAARMTVGLIGDWHFENGVHYMNELSNADRYLTLDLEGTAIYDEWLLLNFEQRLELCKSIDKCLGHLTSNERLFLGAFIRTYEACRVEGTLSPMWQLVNVENLNDRSLLPKPELWRTTKRQLSSYMTELGHAWFCVRNSKELRPRSDIAFEAMLVAHLRRTRSLFLGDSLIALTEAEDTAMQQFEISN